MEPVFYIIMGITVIAVITAVSLYKKKRSLSSGKVNVANSKQILVQNIQSVPTVKFEDLPALTESEESALAEIKDTKLIAIIDNVIPGTLKAVTKTGAVHKYQQTVKNAGQLYQAIIPQGAVLSSSKAMQGAVRGIYHGADGIKGHANLVAVDGNMGGEISAMNIASAAMDVAAMVVGQYYMTQINNHLSEINTELNKIATFQDKEYQGRIYALVATVQKCSQFQVEIMENEELRKLELSHIKGLEDECAKLLGQANLTLKEFEKKKGLDYSSYEKQVAEAQTWYQYQQILLEIMLKIEELTYAFNMGQVSKENCNAMYLPYKQQADDVRESLKAWHKATIAALEIDLDANRRRRQGIEGFFISIPALFNDDLNYRDVSRRTVSMISKQSSEQKKLAAQEDMDIFQKDVRLIAKDGKLYYLPQANDYRGEDKNEKKQ